MARNVSVDSSEVRELEKIFGTTAPKALKKALRRSLRRTRTGARTQASKKVREEYAVKAGRLKNDIVLTRPNFSNFSFSIIGRKKPIGLTNFGRPRQTKAGVSVAVEKGKRKLIKRAFIARGVNGNTQVFTRFVRKGQPPSGRLPIRSLKGPSASDMFTGAEVDETVAEFAQDKFLTELERNLKFFLGRT